MAKFEFKYAEDWYSVQGAETMLHENRKALRAEYTRMRDTAQKRIARLAKSYPESKVLAEHLEGFKKLRDIPDENLPEAFSELKKFLSAKQSTISGQESIKEKTIETWQKQGLNLNESNYNMTIKVLEGMRKNKIVYGSDKALALGEMLTKLSNRQANTWLKRLPQLLPYADRLQEIPKVRGMSFKNVMKALGG